MTGVGRDAGPTNSLVDVPGIRVGQATLNEPEWLTGSTVILAPAGGAVAGVDVRGGGPGTRETDLLDPRNAVDRVHAILLTGGSAYGLAAADGVMAELETAGIGFPVGGPGEVVPIVPTAVLYDLGRGGRFRNRPDAATGVLAYRAATDQPPDQGCVGAGTGAIAAGLKGGIGTASALLPNGATIAALVAVNATGSTVDPHTGELYAAAYLRPVDLPAGLRLRTPDPMDGAGARAQALRWPETPFGRPGMATSIGVIATDSSLSKAWCQKLAGVGHDGLARAIDPVHTMLDGDTLFAMSTAPVGTPMVTLMELNLLLAAAGTCITRAVGRAMFAATSAQTPRGEIRSYRAAFPTAVESHVR